jgi:hypothetical protein
VRVHSAQTERIARGLGLIPAAMNRIHLALTHSLAIVLASSDSEARADPGLPLPVAALDTTAPPPVVLPSPEGNPFAPEVRGRGRACVMRGGVGVLSDEGGAAGTSRWSSGVVEYCVEDVSNELVDRFGFAKSTDRRTVDQYDGVCLRPRASPSIALRGVEGFPEVRSGASFVGHDNPRVGGYLRTFHQRATNHDCRRVPRRSVHWSSECS